MQYDQLSDFHDWVFAASQGAREAAAEQVNYRGVTDFLDTCAEFNTKFFSTENLQEIVKFCHDRGVPTTKRNLYRAFVLLAEDGLLTEVEPPAPEPRQQYETPGDEPMTVDVPGVSATEEADAMQLAKIANDPHATASERREADRKLKGLATRDRIARARFPRGHDAAGNPLRPMI
jgi:hypothetical protein